MRRVLLYGLAFGLVAVGALRAADENVRAIQGRLKAGGFYSGEENGIYTSDTAAAVTRYQIRNGLQITGKLDAQTRHALGVASGESKVPTAKFGEDVWRYLRKSDQERIQRLETENASAAQPRQSPVGPAPVPQKSKPPRVAPPASREPAGYDRERLRDYIAAFVLAGLDPQVGAETEFFADRVDYFGERGVTREKIRRDLQRYDNRWPERRFWLAGELEVKPAGDRLQVSFPLRYELRGGARRSSGKVWKTLLLEKTSGDDLQIVAVNERKVR